MQQVAVSNGQSRRGMDMVALRRFLAALVAVIVAAGSDPVPAQTVPVQSSPQSVREAQTVTIMTDALGGSTPAGAAVEALARAISTAKGLRVHAIAGRGAVENVDDLLFLRGVDFAILNSETLALVELSQRRSDARRRVRWLAHLFDRKIYLLAKGPVRQLSDLAGMPVGAVGTEANGYGAAQALFGLEQINVALTRLPPATMLDDTMVSDFKAVLLVGEELENWRPTQTGWRLVPIPLSAALATAFGNAEVSAAEEPDLTGGSAVPTLQRSTFLGMFNWGPTHTRYPVIQRFVAEFYAALPQMVAVERSVWRQSRMTAAIPGLQRHALAVPASYLSARQLADIGGGEVFTPRRPVAPVAVPAEIVRRDPPAPSAPAPVVASASRVEPPSPPPVATTPTSVTANISALVRPPLSDPEARSGGLVLDVLEQALRAGGSTASLSRQWHKSIADQAAAPRVDGALHVSLPWIGLDCERTTPLSAGAAMACDDALVSEPIVHVAFALFAARRVGEAAEPASLKPGQKVCLQDDADPSVLALALRPVGDERAPVVVRSGSVIECILLSEAGEADAVLAIDFEFADLQSKLGLGDRFRQLAVQLPPRGVHVAVSKSHPQAGELINQINRGLKTLKSSEAYAQSIMRHLRVQ